MSHGHIVAISQQHSYSIEATVLEYAMPDAEAIA